ncbi:MAG: restriction endonuclease [Clostridia bacterium]|nr:restriction endonuclease [Clostridia bacterium]
MARRRKSNSNDLAVGVIVILTIVTMLVNFLVSHWYWFFMIIAVVIFVSHNARKKKEGLWREQLRKTQTVQGILQEFQNNPYAFERYIADIFKSNGFYTKVTSSTNDGGKDIIMTKDGYRYVVEVKLYSPEHKVGREKIQKLHSAMIDSNANYAYFVTTSCFTVPAIEYASKYGICLVDGNELAVMVQQLEQKLHDSIK